MWTWLKALPAKVANLKKIVIDPIDQTICLVRVAAVTVFAMWTWAATDQILHHAQNLTDVAHSGSIMLVAISAAITGKDSFKTYLNRRAP